jgi:hypothetical protein
VDDKSAGIFRFTAQFKDELFEKLVGKIEKDFTNPLTK